jgi:hypothetical protein
MGEEVIVALPPRDRIAPLTKVKSTLLGSSYRAIKEHGHEAAYLAKAPRDLHDVVKLTPAGVWLPVDAAERHYAACESLGLSPTSILEMGSAVAKLTQKSMVSMATSLATAGGMTPWTLLSTVDRYWHRLYEGSAVGLVKLGPKEARFDIAAMPLARYAYWRIALRGIVHTVCAPFCRTVLVKELARKREDEAGYRISWV